MTYREAMYLAASHYYGYGYKMKSHFAFYGFRKVPVVSGWQPVIAPYQATALLMAFCAGSNPQTRTQDRYPSYVGGQMNRFI